MFDPAPRRTDLACPDNRQISWAGSGSAGHRRNCHSRIFAGRVAILMAMDAVQAGVRPRRGAVDGPSGPSWISRWHVQEHRAV